jgi:hypothetical protein
MRGTWRIAAYTDPKGPAIGEASFLVEDYVPERLDVALTPKSPALLKGQPAEIEVSARYLYGAPGSNLEVSGEVVVQASERSGIRGLDGFTVGLDDEKVEAGRSRPRRPRSRRRARPMLAAGRRSRCRSRRSRRHGRWRRKSRCASASRADAPSSAA